MVSPLMSTAQSQLLEGVPFSRGGGGSGPTKAKEKPLTEPVIVPPLVVAEATVPQPVIAGLVL